MVQLPVFMDNQSTTPVDPRVLDAMLPYFTEHFGNPGSTSHAFGWEANDAVESSRSTIAEAIGATAREIVFTSGATESNNLALRGVMQRPRRKGNHVVSVATEHKAILDPLEKLSRRDCQVTLVPVEPADSPNAGRISLQQIEDAICDDTALVSVMLANNEIGVVQQLQQIAEICRRHHVLLHSDATQAVGKMPVDVARLGVDMISFSAHKLYGPKGVGALYVRGGAPAIRLEPQIEGGAQERGRRSGTLNVPGIVGFAHAVQLCLEEMSGEVRRLAELRQRLFDGLSANIDGVRLNGPKLTDPSLRLPGNLNCSFALVDGEALMMSMQNLAVSSGSACTSANPEPSHVLRALQLDDDLVRASLRFGLGRFNDQQHVDFAIHQVSESVHRLRQLSSHV